MKLANIAVIASLFALPALARPGPGMGGGMGPAGGRFAIGNDNTVGWALMTQEEHAAHRAKDVVVGESYDECKAYQREHHQPWRRALRSRRKMIAAALQCLRPYEGTRCAEVIRA